MNKKPGDTTESGRAKLPIKAKLAYGFGGFVEQLMANTFNQLAFPIFNIALGLDARLVGLATAIPRLTDAASDPLMGLVSDNTRSRWGRRRPYILIGGLLTGLMFAVLYMPPSNLRDVPLAWYLGTMAVLFYFAYTVFAVPYMALGLEMTDDYDERTSLQAWRMFFITVKGVVAPWAMKLCFLFGGWFAVQGVPDEAVGVRYVASILGVTVFLGCIPIVRYARERSRPISHVRIRLLPTLRDVFANKPFRLHLVMIFLVMGGVTIVGPLSIYVNNYYVFGGDKARAASMIGISGTVMALIGFLNVPLVTALSRRFGKGHTVSGGLIVGGFLYLSSWFLYSPSYPYLQLILWVLIGPALTCCWMLNPSITADICDYDELKTGLRREGVYSAVFGFIFKAGTGLISLFVGSIIAWSGFVHTETVQTAETLVRLRLAMMLVPFAALTTAGGLFLFFPLNRRKVRQIQEALRRRERLQGRVADQGNVG